MATGWQYIDDEFYYFYSSGAMATNTTVKNCKIGSDGISNKVPYSYGWCNVYWEFIESGTGKVYSGVIENVFVYWDIRYDTWSIYESTEEKIEDAVLEIVASGRHHWYCDDFTKFED